MAAVGVLTLCAITACGGSDDDADESPTDDDSAAAETNTSDDADATTGDDTDDADGADGADEADDGGDDGDAGASSGGDLGTMTRGGYEIPIVGTATVDIGDHSYEFSVFECYVGDDDKLSGGGYSGEEMTADYVQFAIQPEGSSETLGSLVHFVTVADAEEGLNWNAGGSPFLGPITEEHSRITEWTRDGMSATGQALFIEENYAYSQDANADYPEPESTEGTFDISCVG
jgi:hypothetical protein